VDFNLHVGRQRKTNVSDSTELEREVRANLVSHVFTRIDVGDVLIAKKNSRRARRSIDKRARTAIQNRVVVFERACTSVRHTEVIRSKHGTSKTAGYGGSLPHSTRSWASPSPIVLASFRIYRTNATERNSLPVIRHLIDIEGRHGAHTRTMVRAPGSHTT
jgi:hypothetical protein